MTHYQSRLKTSHWTELLTPFISSKIAEEKTSYATPTLGTQPTFYPTSVCLCMFRASASPLLFDVCVWSSHATGARRMCLLFTALAALLCSLEEQVSKHGKVGPFLVLHLAPSQIAVPRCWIAFLPSFSFIIPLKTLLSLVRFWQTCLPSTVI